MTLVSGATGWSALAPGNTHTCGVAAGVTYCWGDNRSKQLGDDSPALFRPTPGSVTGSFTSLASTDHTCATSGATAWCWGSNLGGEIGNGTQVTQPTPVEVVVSDVAQLVAGTHHTCARLISGGAKCWGAGANGELGNGLGTSSLLPTVVTTSETVRLGLQHQRRARCRRSRSAARPDPDRLCRVGHRRSRQRAYLRHQGRRLAVVLGDQHTRSARHRHVFRSLCPSQGRHRNRLGGRERRRRVHVRHQGEWCVRLLGLQRRWPAARWEGVACDAGDDPVIDVLRSNRQITGGRSRNQPARRLRARSQRRPMQAAFVAQVHTPRTMDLCAADGSSCRGREGPSPRAESHG